MTTLKENQSVRQIMSDIKDRRKKLKSFIVGLEARNVFFTDTLMHLSLKSDKVDIILAALQDYALHNSDIKTKVKEIVKYINISKEISNLNIFDENKIEVKE